MARLFSVMLDMFRHTMCFSTALLCLVCGARLCWACGRKFDCVIPPEDRKNYLQTCLPAAIVIYLFGFVIIFNYLYDDLAIIVSSSIICAILAAHFVVAMSMAEMNRNP